MSRINQLLNRLAPAGVQTKPLGEVGELVRGNGLPKSDLRDEGAPAIHYGQIHTHYGVWADATKSFTAPDLAAKMRRARCGDLIIATTSEDDAAVAKATAWIGESEVAVSGDAYIFRHTLDPRYVSYFFQSEQFQTQKKRYISGTKVRRISGRSLARIPIPVPPLEVQHEIVGVLDRFSELEAELAAELEAELEARQRQYVVHRDTLLEYQTAGTRWVTLGEAGHFFGGLTGKSKSDFAGGSARFVSYSNVFKNLAVDLTRDDFVQIGPDERQRQISQGDILFTGSSENADEAGMSSVVTVEPAEPTYLNSFCIGYRLDDPNLLDPAFAKFLFRGSSLRRQIVRTANGVTRFNVSRGRLAKVEFPVPPIEEQRRIAGVLDRFEALVNDLSIGLPAELMARRKQYEYYRDQLLTFEAAAA